MLSPKSHAAYRQPQSTSVISVVWKMRTYLTLALTPIILLPILFSFPQSQNEAKCGYCIGIMAIYWVMEVLPLAVTALLPMVLYPLLGLMASKDVAQMYLPDISFLFIGGLMVAVAVQKSKLQNRVALFVLTVVPPQPCWIMLGLMLVTAFLSMWISNTATTALMVPIVNSVIMELAKSSHRNEFSDCLVGEAMVEERHNENSDGRRKSLGTFSTRDPTEILSKDEYYMAKGLLMSIAFAANIGGTGTITGTASNLVLMGQIKEYVSDATSAMLIAIILFAIPNQKPNFFGRSKNVGTLLDWKTMQEKFPWSVMLLLGGGFAMAAGVKESNLSCRIGEVMRLLQIFPVNTIMAICILIIIFLTNICSNTVTASIFIPIVAELAKSLQIHPFYFMIPTALASSMAFTLPVATPPNAIIFASGLLSVNDMLLAGTLVTIECGLLAILFMMTWATYLFELDKFPFWAYTQAEIVHRNHTLFDLLANTTAK
ncbi:unnamed protein product [Litomosoides sigmodontis]|uniref:Citrate transporter-like domain-containing protein n=1 Tax=Litomosoides sigmodontis TaxID=42156 RepID=A0A3P6U3H0_LITSI|nr:unnamed protein product [Litomosoides sigmodontis]